MLNVILLSVMRVENNLMIQFLANLNSNLKSFQKKLRASYSQAWVVKLYSSEEDSLKIKYVFPTKILKTHLLLFVAMPKGKYIVNNITHFHSLSCEQNYLTFNKTAVIILIFLVVFLRLENWNPIFFYFR